MLVYCTFHLIIQLGAGSFLLHQFSMLVNTILVNFGLSEEMHNPVSSCTCLFFFLVAVEIIILCNKKIYDYLLQLILYIVFSEIFSIYLLTRCACDFLS